MPKNSPSPRRVGAPAGNLNAFKHGFYTRRLKKRDLTGVESTDASALLEEIALIRVFTRRLIESCHPDANFYELAEFLRILCLASSTISRVIRTQFLLSANDTGLFPELEEAIRQINLELRTKVPPAGVSVPVSGPSLPDAGGALSGGAFSSAPIGSPVFRAPIPVQGYEVSPTGTPAPRDGTSPARPSVEDVLSSEISPGLDLSDAGVPNSGTSASFSTLASVEEDEFSPMG